MVGVTVLEQETIKLSHQVSMDSEFMIVHGGVLELEKYEALVSNLILKTNSVQQ
jgi:hypothetical protein